MIAYMILYILMFVIYMVLLMSSCFDTLLCGLDVHFSTLSKALRGGSGKGAVARNAGRSAIPGAFHGTRIGH